MNFRCYISFVILTLSFSCVGQYEKVDSDEFVVDDPVYHYINENGEILLIPETDTSYQVQFENNDGHHFDTVMTVMSDSALTFYKLPDQKFFLKYGWGGLSVSENEIRILEFSSYARLQTETRISQIYSRNFYRTGKQIQIEGQMNHGKGGPTLNWFYFNKPLESKEGYYRVTGKINKEPFPSDYYSTEESPQGMFPDDGVVRYRMVMDHSKMDYFERRSFSGYPVNLHDGNAALAWELADSEAYILQGQETWTEEELKTKITVEGVLIQDEYGSYLKNWEIVYGH